MGRPTAEVVARRSPFLCRLFRTYLRRYVRNHFHAVRLAGELPPIPDGPLLVVCNHPSWWDPLVGLLLADRLGRALYAPMEAAALDRYRFFTRLGVFGVAPGPAGARAFLRTGRAILETPGTALAVTAQGRFVDPRERPVRLMPGVGHLAHGVGRGTVLPVALEYPFWNERLPEALVRYGPPLTITPGVTPGDWARRMAVSLEATQDALAAAAGTRDPKRFQAVLGGRVGVGGVYDRWRRVTAWATGRRFHPAHDWEADP
jgi:1-acyl-sn-glycerol-3-phosphate acyltransferase